MIPLGTSITDLEQAAHILKRGGLAVFPTETVYGLGCDAFNTLALARVFDIKRRPRFDPLIIHIAVLSDLEQIANIDALAPAERLLLKKLQQQFWPGPLTLVLPKRRQVPDLATASLPTVAIRFPAHPVAHKIIELSGGPVAAPSANRFGRLSPTRAEHAAAELGDAVDCIVDGGPCSIGVESTVLYIQGGVKILRHGGISREQIEALTGPLPKDSRTEEDEEDEENEQTDDPVISPGMLKSHYAPEHPLCFHRSAKMQVLPYYPEDGYLFFSGASRDAWAAQTGVFADQSGAPDSDGANQSGVLNSDRVKTLSETGNSREAASHLFEYLRLLDKEDINRIHAEALPEKGIGAAVNDRLRRASAGRR